MTHRILILGGTTEARQLAGKLVRREDFSVTLSLAGRTESPVAQGVPVRVGGFGGAEGMAAYLGQDHVDLLIDATHPYAARISANAAEASRRTGVPILALRRSGWEPVAGDRWTLVDSVAEAAQALGTKPRQVFLAIGRQEAAAFEAAPQHRYLIRSVDPVEPKLAVPDALYLLARGPFPEADERALLEKHGIDAIISKNSGGEATYGKIAAAQALGIEVIMVRRPPLPDVRSAETVDQLAAIVDHLFEPVAERGV
ncbi:MULTISPECIES: cobalt-precorrin-6A reductase [unclassified Mesorhizobium]|uniref:cobalt-precorrin-6A reductase n=1 Tax=unclassified Mesorhizobium TaxID=325217 RepID=UPI000BAE8B03|nr:MULTISPECIES: cobalt-precorrin-6A reductase [unclassified Mesorhizobium]TGT58839.1 cobalt-precorrin-6A reductase [Mesorhizobium sp. M00.F.Ca.ET.170.01.1.1]AZO13189.1 cobalt-precorrin-6A reductase [Mesorhizobium sp. M3A.F.Ca.ET.080.04.2.1]PBB83501.1 cobalt-precorrin-6A reductase [Mesorhizobium sp. WSM3876]RWB75080.1 MAG: cobalt-precorrin-6A reductase [Mesorhizobium sp.]RWB89513.1 MAG: cobalt-precorrin-6A reductase [Mesorhizobium sp.]